MPRIVHAKTVAEETLCLPPDCPPAFKVRLAAVPPKLRPGLLAAAAPSCLLPPLIPPSPGLPLQPTNPAMKVQSLVERCLAANHQARPSFGEIEAALAAMLAELRQERAASPRTPGSPPTPGHVRKEAAAK